MSVPVGPAVPNCELGSAGSRGCGHRHVRGWLLSSPGCSKEPKCITEDGWVKAGLQRPCMVAKCADTCLSRRVYLGLFQYLTWYVGGYNHRTCHPVWLCGMASRGQPPNKRSSSPEAAVKSP